jgi:hypothetical protein
MYQYPYQEEQSWPDPGSLELAGGRRRSAPVLVHVVAVLHYLAGAAALAIAGFGAWIVFTDTGRDIVYPDDLPRFVLGVTAYGLGGVCTIVLARLVQRGGRRGLVAAITLCVLDLGFIGYQSWSGDDPQRLIWLAVPALVLAVCATPGARSWFRPRRSARTPGWSTT